MKVCHLTSVHPRYDVRIFEKECTSLAKAGYEVNLVVADGKGYEEKNGIKIHDVGKPSGRKERMLKTTKKVYRKALELDCDIYHFHDPELLPTGVKLARKGKKAIYDAHEDLPRQIMSKPYLPRVITPFLAFVLDKYEKYAVKRLTGFVSPLKTVGERFGKINKTYELIFNYPIIAQDIKPVPFSGKENAVAYIGGISEIRGIRQLIKAMEDVEGELFLAGKFENQALEKQIKAMPGWEKVKFYGFVSRNEVNEILNKVKGGVVTFLPEPNHVSAQPNKIFEYMAAAIPVIGSNFPLWIEVIEKNNAGICIDPQSPAEIAKAINKILKEPAVAEEMGQNGRKLIDSGFNWKEQEKKLIKFYDSLKTGQK